MIDEKPTQKGENTTVSGLARFGGLDQLDWLMIVLSVLLGLWPSNTIFWDLPDGFLECDLSISC